MVLSGNWIGIGINIRALPKEIRLVFLVIMLLVRRKLQPIEMLRFQIKYSSFNRRVRVCLIKVKYENSNLKFEIIKLLNDIVKY